MNKLKFQFNALIVAFTLILLMSCDKEENETQRNLLVKETIESDLYGEETIDYEYNEKNQLEKVHIYAVSEYYVDDFDISISYSGDSMKEFLVSGEEYLQKMTFSYEGDSITSQMFIKEGDEDWYEDNYFLNVWKLNNQGQLSSSHEYVMLSGEYSLHSYSLFQWVNDNYVEDVYVYNLNNNRKSTHLLSHLLDRSKSLGLLKSASYETTTITALTYSAFNNPYQSLGIFNAAEVNNRNAVSSQEITTSDNAEYEYNYTYEVDVDNYPTKQIRTDKEGNTMTTIYEYKSKN